MTARSGLTAPLVAFLIAGLLGSGLTWSVWLVEAERAQADFERTANLAVNRVMNRLGRHVVLLQATRGLFASHQGALDRPSFLRFMETLDLPNSLPGIREIGLARLVAANDAARAEGEIALRYGIEVKLWPNSDQPMRTPVVLIEPATEQNLSALGFDMYAHPVRRLAIDRALATGTPQMSGPVERLRDPGTDPQTGFMIYLSLTQRVADANGGALDRPAAEDANLPPGLVYASFRGSNLVRAALEESPRLDVAVTVIDVDSPELPIHSDKVSSPGMTLERVVDFGGRQWKFQLHKIAPAGFLDLHLGSALVGMISLMFATATGYAVRARQQEAEQARELADTAAREAEYRGLLLQEMKHRIKNHIARIQSIARQSARSATDLKGFTDAFDARLQAMAAVQEVLAGTEIPRADVRLILKKELQQCLDTDEVEHLMDGPAVTLNERQAHAFAIVAHELVTNAMKYGGLSPRGEGLRITWIVRPGPPPDGQPRLVVCWQERFQPDSPEAAIGSGFGSRLIEASLRGELSGSMTRDFTPSGLVVTLTVPLLEDLNPARPRA